MIGRDLRTIREACGVTMGDLASETGMRVSFISDVERDTPGFGVAEVDLWIAALARIVRSRQPPVILLDMPGEVTP